MPRSKALNSLLYLPDAVPAVDSPSYHDACKNSVPLNAPNTAFVNKKSTDITQGAPEQPILTYGLQIPCRIPAA